MQQFIWCGELRLCTCWPALILPQVALLISRQLTFCIRLCLCLCVCPTLRKPNVETPGGLKSRKLVQRRRNTCPSPQDISKALQSPSPAPSASAASLDDLIQRCLNCFGSSLLSPLPSCANKVCHVSSVSHQKQGYIMEMNESEEWAQRARHKVLLHTI